MHLPANGFTDADIAVSIIVFHPTDPDHPTQFSKATFELRTITPAVTQSGPNAPIHVHEKARLRFSFPGDYEPVEVRFSEKTSMGDPNGFKNLVDRATHGNTAETKDILKKGFKKARWKMSIVIKNDSDQFGVIDPEIVNENEERDAKGGG